MEQRLLIIEDEEDIRETLRDFFTFEGYSVSVAVNGRDAISQLKSNPKPDLILLDLMMPIMNGEEFALHQQNDPELNSIPVIIMSADNQTEAKTKSLGISYFIKKPLSLDHLMELVAKSKGLSQELTEAQ